MTRTAHFSERRHRNCCGGRQVRRQPSRHELGADARTTPRCVELGGSLHPLGELVPSAWVRLNLKFDPLRGRGH